MDNKILIGTPVELKVPKKYQERFDRLERDTELADGMKYMLYLAEGWSYFPYEYWNNVPVFSKKEALDFIKKAYKFTEDNHNNCAKFSKEDFKLLESEAK